MRSMPRSTRVAIATMSIRHRDARRRLAEANATHGPDSPATAAARVEEVTMWNALHAVRSNVGEMPADGSPRYDVRELMRLVGLRGRRFRLNHPDAV